MIKFYQDLPISPSLSSKDLCGGTSGISDHQNPREKAHHAQVVVPDFGIRIQKKKTVKFIYLAYILGKLEHICLKLFIQSKARSSFWYQWPAKGYHHTMSQLNAILINGLKLLTKLFAANQNFLLGKNSLAVLTRLERLSWALYNDFSIKQNKNP